MSNHSLNTNGVCSACGGKVRNIDGKRLTIEQLTELHLNTCPGIHRVTKGKN